jgi:membrane-associated protein
MLPDPASILYAVLHIDQTIAQVHASQGTGIYLLLFGIIFCEIGFLPLFFLPGDPLVFVCGAFCAVGLLNIWIVIPVLLLATVAGSIVCYVTGRSIGKRFSDGGRWRDHPALERSRRFYQARGQHTFLVSPYIAVVRTFAPFAAGLAGMPLRPFLMSVCGGAMLWVVGLVVAGYFFGNVPWVREHVGAITLSGIALGLAALVAGKILVRLRRSP